jgi:putative (di)nucleoside polyphosphate hydrolase
MIPKLWNGQYKGQKQKWFLIKFTGTDSDIHLDTKNQEFREWQWCSLDEIMNLVVPFKKTLYKAIIKEFKKFLN